MSGKPGSIWKRPLRFCLFGVVAAATLIALDLTWISFQGRRDWAHTKAELLARGEKLSLVTLAPPVVADDRNFYHDPLWDEVFDLIESTDEHGYPSWHPRIPYKKQQLNVFNAPLSPDLLKQANALNLIFHGDGSPTALSATIVAIAKLWRSKDRETRDRLAHFVIAALQPLTPVIDHITALLDRPTAAPPLHYEAGLTTPSEHTWYLLHFSRTVAERGKAHFALGQTGLAAEDIQRLFKIANVLRDDPLQISFYIRSSILGQAISMVSRGIRSHSWNDQQLSEFEIALHPVDLVSQLQRSLRGWRGSLNQFVETLQQNPGQITVITNEFDAGDLTKLSDRYILPTIVTADQAAFNQRFQKWIDALEGAPQHGLHRNSFPDRRKDDPSTTIWGRLFSDQLRDFSGPGAPSLDEVAWTQDQLTDTRIACALERYRLAHLSYPKTLSDLVPEYLSKLPTSIVANLPIHYRASAGGDFELWSDGWNETDDGGKISPFRVNYDIDDWVWNVSPGYSPSPFFQP